MRHRRVFKSHQPWRVGAIGTAEHRSVGGEPCAAEQNMDWSQCLCPNCPERWRRIIYMVRDPRATLCSFYKFQTQLGNVANTSSYADFLRMDESRYGFDWPRHVESYLDAADADVFFLKYEDLHSKPEAALSELATWLGVEVTQERLADVIRMSDRKAMQRAEEATGTPLFDQLYPDARRNGFRLVREGSTTTAWRDECGEVDFDALLPGWREADGSAGVRLVVVYMLYIFISRRDGKRRTRRSPRDSQSADRVGMCPRCWAASCCRRRRRIARKTNGRTPSASARGRRRPTRPGISGNGLRVGRDRAHELRHARHALVERLLALALGWQDALALSAEIAAEG